MNNDLKSIALANKKCNKHGLDTISSGNVIAFLMEASEKDYINEEVEWGESKKKIIEIIEKIAHRKEIRDLLATGVKEVAEELDENFDMQVKGQEIPIHELEERKRYLLVMVKVQKELITWKYSTMTVY